VKDGSTHTDAHLWKRPIQFEKKRKSNTETKQMKEKQGFK